MSTVPRATVIMATYNWSTVLPYSIGSVINQTFTDWELLVVGDACTDDSGDVVANVGDPRVRWINLKTPTGHQSGPNHAYDYEDPDHWRLAYDSPEIPYTWRGGPVTRLRSDKDRQP